MIAKERLYLNKTKDKIVRHGDPEASSLLCVPGRDVPKEYLGLVPMGPKERPPLQNKEMPKPENKTFKKKDGKPAKNIKFGGGK